MHCSGDILLRGQPAGISSGVGVYRTGDEQFVLSPGYSPLARAGAGGAPVDLLASSNLTGEDDSLPSIRYQVAITLIKLTFIFRVNTEHSVSGRGYSGCSQTLTLLPGESQSNQYCPDHPPLINDPALFTDF